MIHIIAIPGFKTACLKALKILLNLVPRIDCLFLDLPKELESDLRYFINGDLSYDGLVGEIRKRKIMPEPLSSWEYAHRSVIEFRPEVLRSSAGIELFCYGSTEDEFSSMDIASELTRMILRSYLSDTIDVNAWRSAVKKSIELGRRALDSEVKYIACRAKGDSICLTDMGGFSMKRALSRVGIDVKMIYVETPYHHNPLSILKRKMDRGELGDEDIERLVRCHIDYIREYVFKYENRDRAYYEWVLDNVAWMRKYINRKELAALKSLLNHHSFKENQ